MTKKDYEKLYDYLTKGDKTIEAYFEKDEKGNYTGKFKKSSKCKIKQFHEIFSASIKCEQYDAVANGEGNEQEKIDSVYSSSLQSLLVFHGVSGKNPIIIGSDTFTKVLFEYKNKVIGYPSSIDVVLIGDKSIAFIESKFLEIVRDSTEEKNGKSAARKVVGISYFGPSDNGYKNALKLKREDLDKMKVNYPKNGPFLDDVSGLSKNVQSIDKLDDNTFVYSEGIKQILSHLIGIQSFKNNVSVYEDGEDPIPLDKRSNKKIIYVELYNSFPGFDYAKKRIIDFKKHAKVVKDVIKDKHLVDEFYVMSYQDLIKNNPEYTLSKKVLEYYHLK